MLLLRIFKSYITKPTQHIVSVEENWAKQFKRKQTAYHREQKLYNSWTNGSMICIIFKRGSKEIWIIIDHYMTFEHFPLFLFPPLIGKKERYLLFVYLWTAAQGVCILNAITEPVTLCGRGWRGTRDQFLTQNTIPDRLTHINTPRPAISDGWWSESKSDRNRKATSICPRCGRTAWMSRIDEGEKVWVILIWEWTTIDDSGPLMVLTQPSEVPEVLTSTHS